MENVTKILELVDTNVTIRNSTESLAIGSGHCRCWLVGFAAVFIFSVASFLISHLFGHPLYVLNHIAFGHIIPMLEFAKNVSHFHYVSFMVSASKSSEIKERKLISTELQNSVSFNLIILNDGIPIVDGFTEIPGMERLLEKLREMKEAVIQLLLDMPIRSPGTEAVHPGSGCSPIERPVDIVITERFLTDMTIEASSQRGIPCYIFNCSSGFSITNGLDITDATPVKSPEHPNCKLDPITKEFLLSVNRRLPEAKTIILNTFREADVQALEKLSQHPKIKNIPIRCIGPIFPPEELTEKQSENEEKVQNWLDRQEKRSTVYVSFGSIAALSAEQVAVMASALASLGKPFIFMIDKKSQTFLPGKFLDHINRQWENSDLNGRILAWSPQKLILAHKSTGVFVTHAGWNSILESISGGVPMVAWPMFADQFENAKWLKQNQLAEWIPDTKLLRSRIVPEEEIIDVIQKVTSNTSMQDTLNDWSHKAHSALSEGGSSQVDFMRLIEFDV